MCGLVHLVTTSQGRFHEIVDFMKNDWISVTINNWKLWGPANAINFTFIPGPYQARVFSSPAPAACGIGESDRQGD
jgi:hypothetical protein